MCEKTHIVWIPIDQLLAMFHPWFGLNGHPSRCESYNPAASKNENTVTGPKNLKPYAFKSFDNWVARWSTFLRSLGFL